MHNHPEWLGGFDSRHGVYGLLPDIKSQGGLSMYYLTVTARRKDAKRRIALKGNDLEYLKRVAERNINKAYIVAICDGKWNTVWTREQEVKEL